MHYTGQGACRVTIKYVVLLDLSRVHGTVDGAFVPWLVLQAKLPASACI